MSPAPNSGKWGTLPARALAVVLGASVMLLTDLLLAPRDGDEVVSARVLVGQWSVHLAVLFALAIALLAFGGLRSLSLRMSVGNLGRLVMAFTVLLAAGAAAWPVGSEIAGGAWIAQQSYAPLVRVAPSLVAGATVAAAAFVSWAWPLSGDPQRWRRRSVTALHLLLFVVFALAHHRLMVGRFDGFHRLVYLLAGMSLLIGIDRWWRSMGLIGRGSVPVRVLTGVAALTLLVGGLVAAGISVRSPLRTELISRTLVGDTLLREIGPSTTTELVPGVLAGLSLSGASSAAEVDHAVEPRSGAAPNGRPWNVVLLVVDSLRADATFPSRDRRLTQKWVTAEHTSFLDEWQARTYRFSHARAQASATHRSMPAMFRSLNCNDTGEDLAIGRSLTEWTRDMGLSSHAFVNDFFVEDRYQVTHRLLDGFDRVAVYDQTKPQDFFADSFVFVEQAAQSPFFAWLHYYGMHEPYFDGERIRRFDRGSYKRDYADAMRWFDSGLADLVARIDASDFGGNTIIVVAADHGECLGAHGSATHSLGTFEEDLLVPLYIYVPGESGRRIDAMVGNMDILPTLTELLGRRVDPEHQGRSLVPLMRGDASDGDASYYAENGYESKRIAAIVHGDHKLMYHYKGDLFLRFDLDEDPRERSNDFDPEGEVDRDLMRRMLRVNPSVFAAELDRPTTRDAIVAALDRVDAADPGPDVPFLLKLAGEVSDPRIAAAEQRIFGDARDDTTRAIVLAALMESDSQAGAALARGYLEGVRDRPGEAGLVEAMARIGVREFDGAFVGERMRECARRGEAVAGWLRLIRPWRDKTADDYGAALAAIVVDRAASSDEDSSTLELALDALRSLVGRHEDPALAERLHALLDHPEPRVRNLAAAAIARGGDERSGRRLEEAIAGEDVLMKKAALTGLVGIRGAGAIEIVARVGREDRQLTMDSINLLEEIGGREVLEPLEWFAANDPRALYRKGAERRIERVKRKIRRPRSAVAE